MGKTKLPKSFKKYFWDVDFKLLDFEKNKTFVLKRLLDRGDTQALVWLKKNYNRNEIEQLLLSTRDISQKTANFWADYLKLDHKKVPCLQKPYSRIPFGLSS
ncbi:hypothetical protein HY439_01840 [Candidatus Microgenomates bacterium]|nr:hypothetical protein [Candidatus Microgenomates bacterium]